jgi:hypothetical protein
VNVVPEALSDCGHRGKTTHTSVHKQHIDPAEPLSDPRSRRLTVSDRAHVRTNGEHVVVSGNLRECSIIPSRDRNPGALRLESLSRCQTNAGGTPEYNHPLLGESHIQNMPLELADFSGTG